MEMFKIPQLAKYLNYQTYDFLVHEMVVTS